MEGDDIIHYMQCPSLMRVLVVVLPGAQDMCRRFGVDAVTCVAMPSQASTDDLSRAAIVAYVVHGVFNRLRFDSLGSIRDDSLEARFRTAVREAWLMGGRTRGHVRVLSAGPA